MLWEPTTLTWERLTLTWERLIRIKTRISLRQFSTTIELQELIPSSLLLGSEKVFLFINIVVLESLVCDYGLLEFLFEKICFVRLVDFSKISDSYQRASIYNSV